MSTQCEVYEKKMKRSLEILRQDLAAVRAGRANPAVLDKISVDYFGTATPVNQLASVSAPEPRILMIAPWDASSLKSIEKAIQSSDIGINPQNDGKVIRLAFPQLTEERRKELIKDVKKMGEDSKVSIRNVRRDGVDTFKKQKKNSDLTEDDLKDLEKELQDITDKYCKEADAEIAKKEKELSEIG